MSIYTEKEAARYDRIINQQVYKYYIKKKLQMIKRWVNINDVILDVGCGTGEYTTSLAKHCETIIGLDISPKMIQRGLSKAKDDSLENISFVIGDITRLPFRNQVFNLVFSVNLIHHLVTDRTIVRGFLEKIRCGRHGGYILVFELNPNSLGWSNSLMQRIIRGLVHILLFPFHENVLDNIEEETRMVDISNLFEIMKINICLKKVGGFIPTYCPKTLFKVFVLLEKIMEVTPILRRYGAHVLIVGKVQK